MWWAAGAVQGVAGSSMNSSTGLFALSHAALLRSTSTGAVTQAVGRWHTLIPATAPRRTDAHVPRPPPSSLSTLSSPTTPTYTHPPCSWTRNPGA